MLPLMNGLIMPFESVPVAAIVFRISVFKSFTVSFSSANSATLLSPMNKDIADFLNWLFSLSGLDMKLAYGL
jgi:hypothetical protein